MGHSPNCNVFATLVPCLVLRQHLLLSQKQISMKASKLVVYIVLLAETVCSCVSSRHVMNYMGHEYVDLGLSVVWATCNLGADKMEDCGNNYTWGETDPSGQEVSSLKDITADDNRTYNIKEMVKNSTLRPEFDAARVQWGGYWRMPTSSEANELINHCTWTWTTVNGVKGYRITSKIKGHKGDSIFLPATYEGDTDYWSSYWTSTDYVGVSDATYMYFWPNNDIRCAGGATQCEMPIRPVIPLKAVQIQRL